MEAINRSGCVFLSHTRLHGRFAIRMALANLRTTPEDMEKRLKEEVIAKLPRTSAKGAVTVESVRVTLKSMKMAE